MKNQIKLIVLSFITLLFVSVLPSCGSETSEDQTNQNQNQGQEQVLPEDLQENLQEIEEQEQSVFVGQTLRIIGNKVNVRSKPSIKSDIVTQLMINEVFDIKGKTDKTESIAEQTDYWYEIEKNGQKGWVFGALTTKTLNEKEHFDSENTKLEILGDKVNVRSEPSIKGKVITQLRLNQIVDVKKQSKNYETIGYETDYWYQIEVDGKRGWVFGSLTSRALITEGCSG
jgi:SH3-like domain-containing protein